MPKPKKKILITGGHLTPAVAVIDKLQETDSWRIFYLGRKFVQEGSNLPSTEAQEIPKLGVNFIAVPSGKVPRHIDFHSIVSFLRIPLGFVWSFFWIARIRPDFILSFGGALAVPAASLGKLFSIPILTHEQTRTAGLANLVVEKLADEVAVSWEDSAKLFKKKTVVIGNPLRSAITQKEKIQPLDIDTYKPLVFVTGGNQGAHALNKAIENKLELFLRNFALIHQCGLTGKGNDLRRLQAEKEKLDNELSRRYLVNSWYSAGQMAWILRNADLVVSRAGANITTELAYIGKPCLLIPLPISAAGEQLKNANLLKKAGIAEIMTQEELTAKTLFEKIKKMLKNLENYEQNANKSGSLVKEDAAQKMVELIDQVYEKKKGKSAEEKKSL